MYTGVLDKNYIIKFYRSIGYPIGPPSNLYEYNHSTIKIVLEYRINPQPRPVNILITELHELHPYNKFVIVDKCSNMQLKASWKKFIRDLIDCVIGVCWIWKSD